MVIDTIPVEIITAGLGKPSKLVIIYAKAKLTFEQRKGAHPIFSLNFHSTVLLYVKSFVALLTNQIQHITI